MLYVKAKMHQNRNISGHFITVILQPLRNSDCSLTTFNCQGPA